MVYRVRHNVRKYRNTHAGIFVRQTSESIKRAPEMPILQDAGIFVRQTSESIKRAPEMPILQAFWRGGLSIIPVRRILYRS